MTKAQMNRAKTLLGVVLTGLRGSPFSWNDGERAPWMKLLRTMGVELLGKTGIEKRGHRLKRGAKPVGSAYFRAPISRACDLYVLGVQTVEDKSRARKETQIQLPVADEVRANKLTGTEPRAR